MTRSAPWTSQTVAAAAAAATAGLVLFLIGTSRVSSEVVYDDQVPGINLAIAGVVLAHLAGASFLLSGRRAVAGRRVAVLGPVPQLALAGGVVPAATDDVPFAVDDLLVGADGLRHFHRGSCALAADRDWTARSRAEHEQAGRTPCGVCLP